MKEFKKDPLYLNYLKFLELFRGEVKLMEDCSSIRSDRKEYTFAIPHTASSLRNLSSSADFSTLLVLSDSAEGMSSPWKPTSGLTFMEINDHAEYGNAKNSGFEVVSGNDQKIIEDFSIAQCAGFLETSEAYSGWASWLMETNKKNLGNKDVSFYVAYEAKTPVAGAIAVKSSNCVGIYGVATKPTFRKKGLGTLLLKKIADQTDEGDVIGLQVEADSYAHRYYKKLGFHDTLSFRRFGR